MTPLVPGSKTALDDIIPMSETWTFPIPLGRWSVPSIYDGSTGLDLGLAPSFHIGLPENLNQQQLGPC